MGVGGVSVVGVGPCVGRMDFRVNEGLKVPSVSTNYSPSG